MGEQIKQNQLAIDKFIKDLNDVNKEYEALCNSKIKFQSKEARDEYDRLHDEIAKRMQDTINNFKNNKY